MSSAEKIATNVLASRLMRLEENKLVIKCADPDNLNSALFELTPKGIGLLPTVLELSAWSAEYEKNLSKGKDDVAEMQANRDTIIEQLQTKLLARYHAAT